MSNWWRLALVAAGVAACVLRIGYVLAEPSSNPFFAEPGLDAGYYVDWARHIHAGAAAPEGAYYLAPLYAFFLAGCFAVFGENLVAVALLQQALALVAVALLGWTAWRAAGLAAGWWTFVLGALYQPLIFFSARTMSEAVGVFLLAGAIALGVRGACLASGALSGVAALARPNFLLVPIIRACAEFAAKRWKDGFLLLLGAAVAVAPVTLRNLFVAGHPVVISSNGGITLYHGNGPAPLGIYNPPDGFSGALSTQRAEATALARFRSGETLDDVDADRWWGRQAVRERLRHPLESAVLLVRRLGLTLDSYEHGLDESPAMDRNPWRITAHVPRQEFPLRGEIPLVPFGALAGLAAAGLILRRGSPAVGRTLWTAVLACAATPLIFYVSSRYRLPLAMLLTVPAGVGASALLSRAVGPSPDRRQLWAGATAITIFAGSLSMPFDDLRAAEESGVLANQAAQWKHRGDLAQAERLARAAVVRDPDSAHASFSLGVVLAAVNRGREAEEAYRGALRIDPGHAASAANLAGLLTADGRAAEAIPYLRSALAVRPTDSACWTNLVIAHAESGDLVSARAAAGEAARVGVVLEWGLLQAIGLRTAQGGPER